MNLGDLIPAMNIRSVNKKMDEKDTRQNLIDKKLLQSGWNVKDPSRVTEELPIERKPADRVKERCVVYGSQIFSDYALLGNDGCILAVVEAKNTSKDARVGREQARIYAENIRDHKNQPMPFVFYTNGHDIYFWDTERFSPRKVFGFPTRDDFERMLFMRDCKPLSHEMTRKKGTSKRIRKKFRCRNGQGRRNNALK